MINYNNNEKISWIASRTFMNDHYGRTLTEFELEQRLEAEKEYQLEISQVSEIIKTIPGFDKLPIKDKINLTAEMILSFRSFNERENNRQY